MGSRVLEPQHERLSMQSGYGPFGLPRVAQIGFVVLGLSAGILTPLAIEFASGQTAVLTMAAGIAVLVALICSAKWPWLPVVCYWFVYSFISDLRLLCQGPLAP